TTLTAPTPADRPIEKLGKHACRLAFLFGLSRSFGHLGLDHFPQLRIASKPQHILHLGLLFTPTHQLLPAKPGIGAHDDQRLGPALANPAHDPLQLLLTPRRSVLIGLT